MREHAKHHSKKHMALMNQLMKSGKSFTEMYPNANNFTLFNDQSMMLNYMAEFAGEYASTASQDRKSVV